MSLLARLGQLGHALVSWGFDGPGDAPVAAIKIPCPTITFAAPVHALVGTDDRLASRDSVSGWADRTTAAFTVREFEGNHFYFAEHLAEVVAEVETRFGGQLV